MSLQYTLGIAATVFDAVLFTCFCASTKYLTAHEWPVYRMESCACSIVVIFLIPFVIWGRKQPGSSSEIGWIVGRAFCGSCDVLCRVIAIWLGTSLGDVAALTSINMVFAAFLGRLFLKEDLALEHILAVCCSLLGAVMISKPGFLFNRSGGCHQAVGGQALSILSGFFSASTCICARKSYGTPLPLIVVAVMLTMGISSLLVPYTFPVGDASLVKLSESPRETIAWLSWLSVAFIVSTFAYSAGTAWCPAAISSTVHCSMSMVSGYVLQALFFGQVPCSSTLLGTVLMFIGVVLMASARRPNENSSSTDETAIVCEANEQVASDTASVASMDSIASFVAMEFAECAPRQRRLHLARHAVATRDIAVALQVSA